MRATDHSVPIRRVEHVTDPVAAQLAEVLVDCVEGGASVSFMHPLDRSKAQAFWRKVGEGVAAGDRFLFIAEDDGAVVGTVQLMLGLPENQPHRAEISKMLVHRRARRRGIGSALMKAAEASARSAGKTLLVLDTASSDAARIYERLGWTLAGIVPDYALWPRGGFCDTSIYYRRLA